MTPLLLHLLLHFDAEFYSIPALARLALDKFQSRLKEVDCFRDEFETTVFWANMISSPVDIHAAIVEKCMPYCKQIMAAKPPIECTNLRQTVDKFPKLKLR